jgi:hypothetical protein
MNPKVIPLMIAALALSASAKAEDRLRDSWGHDVHWHGRTMPAAMRTHWCLANTDSSDGSRTYDKPIGGRCPAEDSDDDNSVLISATRLDWANHTCAVKYMGVFRHTNWLGLQCRGRGKLSKETWKDELRINLAEGGKLVMIPRN